MQQEARRFLSTLQTPQRARALFPFSADERFVWYYVPHDRMGLPLKEMTSAQQKAALDLLHVSLSASGAMKVETIRKLENVLREMERGQGPTRDPDLYYISIFGEPSEKGPWGWRFEGHHISLHWTVLDGKVIASTPQFLGTNPAEVRNGPMKGTRVLKAEEDLARALLVTLNEAQRKQTILSATAPPDIITGMARQAAILEDRGIAYGDLRPSQQGMLHVLIQEIAGVQSGPIMKQRLAAIQKTGLARVKFAWMGGSERGQGCYYRIQGSTFLIEFDDTQNDANHIHLVWRDFKGDFGLDLLAMHYHAFTHTGHEHESEGSE